MIGKLFTRKFLKLKLKHSTEKDRLNNGKAEKLLNYLSTNTFSSAGSEHSDKSEASAVRIRQRPQIKSNTSLRVRLFFILIHLQTCLPATYYTRNVLINIMSELQPTK